MPNKATIKTVSDDLANVEGKVDTLTGNVNQLTENVDALTKNVNTLTHSVTTLTGKVGTLPTKEDMEKLLDRAFGLSKMKADHERMKAIIRKHHNVEV